MTDILRSPKIKTWHLARNSIVYVRQSTPQQLLDHQESTARQYALVDRAYALGWPAQLTLTIDDDLGKSGQSVEGRQGFQRLLTEVALDRVGLILSLEMSRLARSNADWHQLLELCARFRTLLADADGLYDPNDYNDRLLLGLKGTMSEAELHILKERMYQGKLNKARRGALFNLPPIGYVRSPEGGFVIDPDEQVQAVVHLIFDQFDHQTTLHGLLRYLVHHKIQLPVRGCAGTARGRLQWHKPNRATLSNLLHHPIYAGAYRYGHRPTDPRRKQPGRPNTGKLVRRAEECEVLIKDHLPAYITWDRFEANRKKLADNRARHEALGAPRQGAALLCGLLYCGRCHRRMHVRYGGSKNGHHYVCGRGSSSYGDPMCQCLSGRTPDDLVAAEVLRAVQPAALQASLAAVADVERERAELKRQWELRIERARLDSERAARQYHACEPENRLVVRELERRWEAALTQQRQTEEEYARWRQTMPPRLNEADRKAIELLAQDLAMVFEAETTTPQDRQQIVRLLVERITVLVDKESERVQVKMCWHGGQTQEHTLRRAVSRYKQQEEYPRLVQRLTRMCQERLSSAEIAERLNEEGFRPPKRAEKFNSAMVTRLAAELGLQRRARHGSAAGLEKDEYRPAGLAEKLGVAREVVKRWAKVGWLNVRRDEDGHHIIWADEEEIKRLRELHGTPQTWTTKERRAALQKPKQRPKP